MDGSFVFRIVIAYEHFNAGMRAKRLTDRMAAQLHPQIAISTDAWKFELLGDAHLKELAGCSAAEADMLIIAANGNTELPAHVTQWIEQWAFRERNEAGALVALHNLEQKTVAELPPLRASLRRIAEQGNVQLFWYGDTPLAEDPLCADVTPDPCGGPAYAEQLAGIK
jgi:hypothetical protein